MSAMEGLRAIVTGGASGIGEAIVHRLVADGVRVAVLDIHRGDQELVDYVLVDVSDNTSVVAGVEAAAQALGGLDVVVNNAGIGIQGTIEDNTDDEWLRVFEVNLMGAVRVSRAALPWLRESEHASIVNMCSIASTIGLPARAAYGATKGALYSLTLQMAADHVREGIRVNGVSPGTTETPWVTRLLASAADPITEREALVARQPHGRLVQPDEIADAVAYLAGPLSRSTVGVILSVDGGMAGVRLPPH